MICLRVSIGWWGVQGLGKVLQIKVVDCVVQHLRRKRKIVPLCIIGQITQALDTFVISINMLSISHSTCTWVCHLSVSLANDLLEKAESTIGVLWINDVFGVGSLKGLEGQLFGVIFMGEGPEKFRTRVSLGILWETKKVIRNLQSMFQENN